MAERILVVDDEEPIRAIIKSILDTANYQCQQCDSGTEALRILDENGPFQLLIYDLHLKDMGGIALLARIRDKYPELSVVMVTTVHNISVAVNAIRNGAYDYLLKPFEREQLLITVARALEHRRLLTAMKNLDESHAPLHQPARGQADLPECLGLLLLQPVHTTCTGILLLELE